MEYLGGETWSLLMSCEITWSLFIDGHCYALFQCFLLPRWLKNFHYNHPNTVYSHVYEIVDSFIMQAAVCAEMI
jgi:hypothetical protein